MQDPPVGQVDDPGGARQRQAGSDDSQSGAATFAVTPPSISLPKGGGAVRGIGEKFAANPVTGTGSMTVPIATSPGRSSFGPQLSLSYDSGAGNGPFGFGWSLSLPQVTRKTDKGLPQYLDGDKSDVFLLSGAEDLVPVLRAAGTRFQDDTTVPGFTIHRYRPRTEGLFARIERWTNQATGEIHWRSITRENVTTLYGKTAESRIADPDDAGRVFSWLICASYDDQGNAIIYNYAAESDENIDETQANERNRVRTANRYVKRIRYGNRQPNRDAQWQATDPAQLPDATWMFEVGLDYDEQHYEELQLDPMLPAAAQHRFVRASSSAGGSWSVRPDPFSSHRAGFEVRTYRRCHRVLMFHRFSELGTEPCLVRSTEFDYTDLDYSQPTTIEAELEHPGSTRFASFIRSVTQSGFVRDETQPVVESNGVKYVTYLRKSTPPLEFEYTKAAIQDEICESDADSLENLPIGLDGQTYQWVDLDGEGISGVFTEQAGSWFYKRNLSPVNQVRVGDKDRTKARFGPLELVATKPAASIAGGQGRFLDLAGDGQLDLAVLDGPAPGFYERTQDEDWKPFKTFGHVANVAWDDPNLRFVDLNGDGHADVLITAHEVITWHPSLAEEGFDAARKVWQPLDEEQGPRLVFADGTQSIYLADMCGDGLTDLLRIRNGEVCYWPNRGYGRFGAKVTMDNAPHFDFPDQFDQRRIRVADIDGSGTNDIIYLGRDSVRLYFNQSGNRWSESRLLNQFPRTDNLSSVMTVDLLGNGTACLVWSSPLQRDSRRAMRYIDLMGGQKPHLLIKSVNNLGAETHVHYSPSTKFYLNDKLAGKPWITKIPFPVHVVERVETFDCISGNRFVTRYAYHHGYFDGTEREFRGFGMVEQFDTEEFAALNAGGHLPIGTNVEEASHVPPVLTKTWFHTGVYVGRDHVSNFFAGLLDANDQGEYYREPGLTNDVQARELLLEDTVLPSGLTADEEREASRALKGSMLRQEVYALDGTDREEHPFNVTEQNFTIRRVQPKGQNRHAVFFTHSRESISYHYERNPADPRIAHRMTLEVDEFGNVLKEAAIGYGRSQADPSLDPVDQAKQSKTLVTYTENRVTNSIEGADDNRTPLPCETRVYELTKYSQTGPAGRFQFSDFVQQTVVGVDHVFDSELKYEEDATIGRQRRLIEQIRTLYRPDDLGVSLNDPLALLPLGQVEAQALTGESYKLAFTPGLLSQIYRRPLDLIQPPGAPTPENLLPNPALVLPVDVVGGQAADRGGYVDLDGDGHWWIPAGRIFFSPNAGDTAAQERTHARQHFFLPHRFRDPFHTLAASTESFVNYDGYDLLVVETRDALANRVTAGERDIAGNLTVQGNDYRMLQPKLSMDPNRNRSMVAFDALGMVVGTAAMGEPEENLGDSLTGFVTDLTDSVILDHLADPLTDPHAVLGRATSRLVYELFTYYRTKDQPEPQPTVVYTMARETHDADLLPGQKTKIQHSISYSDGFGREIQQKKQAEPGPVPLRDVDGSIVIGANGQPEMTPDAVSPRWVGSGWTVFNNKGKPVRQYEPFFTDRHRFEFNVRIGVSSVLFYDPVQRVVATLHPNHTWGKAVFDPWRQETWDVNDTVLVADPKNDNDVSEFFRRLPDAEYLPTWHEQRKAGALGPEEQAAATKAAIHADTQPIMHLDSLGRTFMTVAHNKFKRSDTAPADPPNEEFYATRVVIDIEGNQCEVIDALDRVVMRYNYDMLGNRIHRASMEAGERWMLNDVAANQIRVWDSRGNEFRSAYEQLRRPIESYVREAGSPELQVERTVYGETTPNPGATNRRGKVVQLFDQAGVVNSDEFDFKGNLLHGDRQLAVQYKTSLDWSAAVPLEAEIYATRTSYDALNRPNEKTAPDNSVIRPGYNEANLLDRVEANLRGASVTTAFVTDIDYDAKGQRTRINYGNSVSTTYEYDPLTFRLIHLLTGRHNSPFPDNDCPQPPPPGWPGCQLQNLHYTYDPAGNIIHIRDDAQQTILFRNHRVEPSNEYTYDAVYRLLEATGREHLGQTGGPLKAPTAPDAFNGFHTRLDHRGDGNAMGNYLQRFLYDAVGNILGMQHRGSSPVNPGWTRNYNYNESSQLEIGKQSNRLTSTVIGAVTENYQYAGSAGVHGNITTMQHLPVMEWDYRDHLQSSAQQVVNAGTPETTYYVYDSHGQRVRKVTERKAAAGQMPTRSRERIYLGAFEIHREYANDGAAVALERETLHIMDDKQRIALVETRTIDVAGTDPAPPQLIRFQLGNHLGSASLELDELAQIISYEEYTPYGSTSYQAVRNQTETSKRYRYTGKERDEESGLYYHGARYYAAWLGRWTSSDPAGLVDGVNLFVYVSDNPIGKLDVQGYFEIDWGAVGRGALYAVAGIAVAVVVVAVVAGTGGAAAAGVATYLGATATTAATVQTVAAGTVYVGAAAYGGYQTGRGLTESVSGRDYETGQELTDTERSEVIGETAVMVGAIAFGGRRALQSRAQARARGIADQSMIDTLVETRRGIPAESNRAARTRANKTFSTGRTASGENTPVRESIPRGGTHAEPQTVTDLSGRGNNQTVAVDQVPCTACDPMLESTLPPGSRVLVPQEVNGVRPLRSIDPNYTRGVKGTSEAAARGEVQVEPYEIIRTPRSMLDMVEFTPVSLPYEDEEAQMSIDPSLPTPAEIEAQQSLPEPDRYY